MGGSPHVECAMDCIERRFSKARAIYLITGRIISKRSLMRL